ncbi:MULTISPECIES: sigmaY antisigma factor component [unclassified Paenibacillus]|uniref:sigmaY antisigma factor component n=1 Tax=unclassified Paenibacillus TaxID=185978 RepID=UPI002F3E23F6
MEQELANSIWFWLCVAAVLITQSTWLFIDARKHGSNYWFWGLWGLIQSPIPLIVYWIVVRKEWFRRRNGNGKY